MNQAFETESSAPYWYAIIVQYKVSELRGIFSVLQNTQ